MPQWKKRVHPAMRGIRMHTCFSVLDQHFTRQNFTTISTDGKYALNNITALLIAWHINNSVLEWARYAQTDIYIPRNEFFPKWLNTLNHLCHKCHYMVLYYESNSINPLIFTGKSIGWFITSRPRQNGRHLADDIVKFIFLNESVWIPIEISLKFVPKGPIDNIPALV